MTPPTIQRIPVTGGVSLHVRTWAGNGAPCVLVHGLASNARLWDGVARRLAAAGHAVAAVDQRGHGLSDKPDDGYDYTTVSADLTSLIDSLGYDRPLVAGQSWGASVVMELAIRHPGHARAVACVDGGTMELSRPFPTWEAALVALTPPRLTGEKATDMELLLRRFHPDWPDEGIAGSMANFEIRSDGTVAPWLSIERHLAILRHLWEYHPAERYPLLTCPVLLIPADRAGPGGDRDERLRAIGEAEKLIPGPVVTRPIVGDHDLHAQHPDEVAELLSAAATGRLFT